LRHRVPDLSAYATKMRVPLLRAMPPDLVRAHHRLDAAVDAAYSKKKFSGDSDRVAFLFELYQQISSPLESNKTKKSIRRRKAVHAESVRPASPPPQRLDVDADQGSGPAARPVFRPVQRPNAFP
jgi:hypothetical protein